MDLHNFLKPDLYSENTEVVKRMYKFAKHL
jgi:hypothetical protein